MTYKFQLDQDDFLAILYALHKEAIRTCWHRVLNEEEINKADKLTSSLNKTFDKILLTMITQEAEK